MEEVNRTRYRRRGKRENGTARNGWTAARGGHHPTLAQSSRMVLVRDRD
jgi:hypothetical protein